MPLVPRAKITVPRLPPEFVERRAQRADLDAQNGEDIGLVCAPAGYGKTLLLADWALRSTQTETAWVGLERDDNDPRRLWSSVVAAVAGCQSVPRSSPLHAPWIWRPGAQPEFLAELVDALRSLPRPIRLVLDNVHELVEPEALHGLGIFLRNRPGQVQLILSSRLDPPLSLPRLRLAGRLWELRCDRLRFSVAEAATLLEKSGLHLTLAQVEVLHQRTEGCPAGGIVSAEPRMDKDDPVQKISLDALAREQLELAKAGGSGRSARTVHGGHERVLRQTVIALRGGQSLAEHESPGEATVHVLRGRVRLVAGADSWDGRQGDLLIVPDVAHSLEAVEDAAVLLTVAKTRTAAG
ncbi:AAA family ATPase [Pseudonocardia hispaniensis]|uniref:AAA family ATPase n=1 Tax=Pseudonocardia hispaniensis TaxID=904933 RepID=A0ABW1J2Q5_9PSEU